jgi:hypothetical protein
MLPELLVTSRKARALLTKRLFPQGVPRLWCPTLTHFAARGEFDEPRIRRHLQLLAPYVKGVLVPGSTGEGWEMSDADIQHLLAVVLDAAKAGPNSPRSSRRWRCSNTCCSNGTSFTPGSREARSWSCSSGSGRRWPWLFGTTKRSNAFRGCWCGSWSNNLEWRPGQPRAYLTARSNHLDKIPIRILHGEQPGAGADFNGRLPQRGHTGLFRPRQNRVDVLHEQGQIPNSQR